MATGRDIINAFKAVCPDEDLSRVKVRDCFAHEEHDILITRADWVNATCSMEACTASNAAQRAGSGAVVGALTFETVQYRLQRNARVAGGLEIVRYLHGSPEVVMLNDIEGKSKTLQRKMRKHAFDGLVMVFKRPADSHRLGVPKSTKGVRSNTGKGSSKGGSKSGPGSKGGVSIPHARRLSEIASLHKSHAA